MSRLFTNSRGGALRYSNWRRTWKAACAKTEFHDLNFHDLRALAATSMLAAGDDVKTAQVRLSHDSIITTTDSYARQSPDADRLAAAAIGRPFR